MNIRGRVGRTVVKPTLKSYSSYSQLISPTFRINYWKRERKDSNVEKLAKGIVGRYSQSTTKLLHSSLPKRRGIHKLKKNIGVVWSKHVANMQANRNRVGGTVIYPLWLIFSKDYLSVGYRHCGKYGQGNCRTLSLLYHQITPLQLAKNCEIQKTQNTIGVIWTKHAKNTKTHKTKKRKKWGSIHTGVAFSATVLLGTLTVLPRNGTHNLALDHLKLSELAPPPLINITRAPPFLLFLSILASRAAGLACEEQEGDEDEDEGNEPFALHAAGHWMCKTPASSSRAAIFTAYNWNFLSSFASEVKNEKGKD